MRFRSLWLLLVVLSLVGCVQGITEIRPPEIRYGEDVCADCNMIISDPRFASAYSLEIAPGRYQQVAFDDIGDMLVYVKKNPDLKIAGSFVHDYESEEWLDAPDAFFVVSSDIPTPMNSGIIAFATQEMAEAEAQKSNGELLSWEELQALEPTMKMHGQ